MWTCNLCGGTADGQFEEVHGKQWPRVIPNGWLLFREDDQNEIWICPKHYLQRQESNLDLCAMPIPGVLARLHAAELPSSGI